MKPFIIAEIGINHDGKIERAIRLIKLAKKAGANAVKFQLFEAKTLASDGDTKNNLFSFWSNLQLTENDVDKLILYCKKIKIEFFCSVFDDFSLNIIKRKKIKYIKIASSDLNDHILLKKINKLKKIVILSTGMGNEKEIGEAVKILNKKRLIILHCVSMYPCPPNKINLFRMIKLREKFKVEIGFSDHSIGNSASIAAMHMGAKVIEKHFTDDKKRKGGDHSISADYKDLKYIVKSSNEVPETIGLGDINPSPEEKKNIKLFRKSLFYTKAIKAGNKISINDITIRRPNFGIEPFYLNKILSKKIIKSVKKNNPVRFSDFS